MKNLVKNSSFIICLGLFILSCSENRKEEIKLQQYTYQGSELYKAHCTNCHQADGSGLGKLIPPIDSTYLSTNLTQVICGIKYGLTGAMTIQNIHFDKDMPGNTRLTALEIAEIVTYIDQKWGKRRGIIRPKVVSKALRDCQ
ncbi:MULTISPECIES: cytochrome c [Reichenbachiella]|uniref:Cytochrome c n=1 Tax=Reichenbachiella agariperforans TaxID=156994 RepID=A0A1M6LAN3_REIAG|nr:MULTISPECIES: cytochrome c [Reichenbachiella]RJE74228.1 hypothetical protein BGP76_13670 [Reichenbachiella sp. MSK19-1]SHJ68223.1 Cytochrome c [Reichenbachiella agariperforans]